MDGMGAYHCICRARLLLLVIEGGTYTLVGLPFWGSISKYGYVIVHK